MATVDQRLQQFVDKSLQYLLQICTLRNDEQLDTLRAASQAFHRSSEDRWALNLTSDIMDESSEKTRYRKSTTQRAKELLHDGSENDLMGVIAMVCRILRGKLRDPQKLTKWVKYLSPCFPNMEPPKGIYMEEVAAYLKPGKQRFSLFFGPLSYVYLRYWRKLEQTTKMHLLWYFHLITEAWFIWQNQEQMATYAKSMELELREAMIQFFVRSIVQVVDPHDLAWTEQLEAQIASNLKDALAAYDAIEQEHHEEPCRWILTEAGQLWQERTIRPHIFAKWLPRMTSTEQARLRQDSEYCKLSDGLVAYTQYSWLFWRAFRDFDVRFETTSVHRFFFLWHCWDPEIQYCLIYIGFVLIDRIFDVLCYHLDQQSGRETSIT